MKRYGPEYMPAGPRSPAAGGGNSGAPTYSMTAPLGTNRARVQRRIVSLVLLLFWLLLLEGVLRKWVAPQFAKLLFFVRDPVVLLLYLLAFRANLFRGAPLVFGVGMLFGLVSIALAAAQIISSGNSSLAVVAAYGWRNYFLYLPLPFVIAACFRREELTRFARHVIIATAAMAPLVIAQAASPASAVINRGIAEDEAFQFKSFDYVGSKIRPSGFFTSAAGMAQVAPSTLAFVLALWLVPRRQRAMSVPWLAAGAIATACCLAVGGSRGAFVHCGLVLIAALSASLLVRKARTRATALVVPIVLTLTAVVLYPIVFPESYELLEARVAGAHAAESKFSEFGIFGRAFSETYGFVRYMEGAPLAGYGLGLGGNGRIFLGRQAASYAPYAESDWSRHIVDLGPIVGLLFIVYRIWFTVWLLRLVVGATRFSSNPMPLALFGYVGVHLFFGQVTGHGSVNGYTWLFLGMCLASCHAVRDPV